MNIKDKKITILGAVRSGIGAAKLAKLHGAFPFVSDMGNPEKLETAAALLKTEQIDFEFGVHSQKVFDCDFIITSPGVPTNSAILVEALKRGIKVISEIEFAYWFCKGKIIAITGTNGKTTTTSLCHYALNKCGVKAHVGGNIGFAFSEIVSQVKEDEFVVLELSSFQLDYIDTFKPNYSILLNITPDHLDRYSYDFGKYAASKLFISKNQIESDYYIYNADDEKINEFLSFNTKVSKQLFSIKNRVNTGAYSLKGELLFANNGNEEVVCLDTDLSLKGEHNLYNSLSVLAILKLIGIESEKIKNAFATFPGVEHRLEFVKEINGVQYINDSKATNVDAVWYALRSFRNPIYLILGGKDKGNDYNQIKTPVLNNVKKIYAIGSSADKVFNFFKDIVPTEKKDSLEDCLVSAKNEAVLNDIVLLSPACASFDMFDNYEHRGEVFKEIINNL
ncbi:MAG: UDP-N-acetylmuramoyl-L-alanine--D-glutamate ligase [bacterium]